MKAVLGTPGRKQVRGGVINYLYLGLNAAEYHFCIQAVNSCYRFQLCGPEHNQLFSAPCTGGIGDAVVDYHEQY